MSPLNIRQHPYQKAHYAARVGSTSIQPRGARVHARGVVVSPEHVRGERQVLDVLGGETLLLVRGREALMGHRPRAPMERLSTFLQVVDVGRRFPVDLVGRNRIGDPLQLERTDLLQQQAAACADEHAHDVWGKDLAPVATLAQPLGNYDGGAEVVVVLASHFARVNPDPQSERMCELAILPIDGDLHRNSGRGSVRGRVEDDY
jgi:hypothetical protein